MKNSREETLIAKHLSGELTQVEQNEFRDWLNSNKRNREEFDNIALAYQLSKVKPNRDRKSIVLDRLAKRIEVEEVASRRNNKVFSVKMRWAVAASIILFISIGILFNSEYVEEETNSYQSEIVIKENPSGQKSKIFLPDGSIVWLNSQSRLSYEAEFNDSIRYVEMEGEAYFEVRKDADRPFIVKSKELMTTALGTAFNINTFGDQGEIKVALINGKVSVDHANSSLIILPGEGVLYNPIENYNMSKISIDKDAVKRWKDGVLELQNASLRETINQLSRWYGVKFNIKNTPERVWDATGVFDNEYLENVLNTLSFSQDFEYQMVGKHINITFIKK